MASKRPWKSKKRLKGKPKVAAKRAKKKLPPLVQLPEGAIFPAAGAYMQTGMDARILAARHKTRDDAGGLRGGSMGCVLSDEEYTGNCIRASAARFLGAEPSHPVDKWRATHLMFDGGHTSEDYFWRDFVAGLPAGFTTRREEDFPLLDTISGLRLTGREDIVVVREETPEWAECLIELKNVSSLPTDLLFSEQPKLEHLIQLGNYLRIVAKKQGDVPGQLWYTSRVIHSLPTQWAWVRDQLPAFGESAPGSESVEWSKPMYGKPPFPTKIRPFYLGFHVRWHEGVLHYSRADDRDPNHTPTQWAATPITAEGIVSYYEQVAELATNLAAPLPPPPTPYLVDGSKKNYRACDYCDWNSVCSAVGENAGQWREAVLNHVEPVDTGSPQP